MNKKFILIFIFLVSCTFSDDTSPKNSPMETTVITTAEGVRSTNYLDYREIKPVSYTHLRAHETN